MLRGVPRAAQPIERPLTPSAERALPFIRSGVERGLSSTQIQRALSEAGMGVRRTDLLEAIRRVKGTTLDVRRYLAGLGDRRPDPARIPRALTAQTRPFAATVAVRFVSPETGELTTRYVTVSMARLRPPSEIAEIAVSRAGKSSGPLEQTPADVEILGLAYDPTAPVFD